MLTARVELCNESKLIKQEARVLLDSGSQRTYITEELRRKLKLHKESEQRINLATLEVKSQRR